MINSGQWSEGILCSPLCSECNNGGTCIAPNHCRCQEGYTGDKCQYAKEVGCSPDVTEFVFNDGENTVQ